MSLLWPDGRLAILPDRVAVVVGRTVTEIPVSVGTDDGIPAAVSAALKKSGCRGRLEIVLSHVLAPVWLLPTPPVRLSWQETQGWVREQLVVFLGEAAGQYRPAFEPVPPGEPILVSALDEAWLAGLQAVLGQHGARASAVRPWFSVAANRHRAKLKRGSSWLALAEPGRLTLAFFEAGRLRILRGLAASGDMAAALRDGIRRESLLAGESSQAPVWLEACGVQADWRPPGSPIEVRQIGAADDGASLLAGS